MFMLFQRAVVLGAMAIALAMPVRAELEVMSSTAPALKPGTKLPDDRPDPEGDPERR